MKELNEQHKQEIKDMVANTGLTSTLGVNLTKIEPGEVEGEIEWDEKHMNYVRGVHGGTFFTLADTVSGFCVYSMGYACTTVNSSIEYLRPGVNCKKIICHAKILQMGRTLARVNSEIKNEYGKLLCTTNTLFYILGEQPFENKPIEKHA